MNTASASASTALSTSPAPAVVAKVNRRLNTSVVNNPEIRFGTFIDSKIMGQPNARKAARVAFRRTMSKLRTTKQPYYVIVAPGPTTSGKSELAYRLGEFFHGNRLAVLKIDGSEYMEKHNLSHLTGASPNLVGYTNRQEKDYVAPRADEKDLYAELSQHNLTRSRMGSKSQVTIVLIDEWEKACLEFNNIMLSIFRDGTYTLGNGEIVDFSNCIFVLTANIGSAAVEEADTKNGIGFNAKKGISPEDADKIITDHLRAFAPPEFRARVEENGEICIFHKLTSEQIGSICELKVRELCSVVEQAAKIQVEVDESARKFLLSKAGSVPKMNGAVKSMIIDVLDNELAKKEIVEGSVVTVTHVAGSDDLFFDVEVLPIITDFTPEMYAQLTAEADQRLAQTGGKTVKSGDAVDQSRLQAAVEAAAKTATDKSGVDGATATEAAVSLQPVQPFKLQFRCKTEAAQTFHRKAVWKALAEAPNTMAVKVELTFVEPFVVTFDVFSTLNSMVALKGQFPKMHIHIVSGELEA